jgi:hypothetical protein
MIQAQPLARPSRARRPQERVRRRCIEGECVCRFLAEDRDEIGLTTWRCCHPLGTGQRIDIDDSEGVCGFGESSKTSRRCRPWVESELKVLREETARARNWRHRAARRLGRTQASVQAARRRYVRCEGVWHVSQAILDQGVLLFHDARTTRIRLERFRREHGVKSSNICRAYWRRLRNGGIRITREALAA